MSDDELNETFGKIPLTQFNVLTNMQPSTSVVEEVDITNIQPSNSVEKVVDIPDIQPSTSAVVVDEIYENNEESYASEGNYDKFYIF